MYFRWRIFLKVRFGFYFKTEKDFEFNLVFPGRKLGFTIDLGKLHNVSLGQGQEAVAEVAMEKAAKEGHWVILQVGLEEMSLFWKFWTVNPLLDF